MPIPSDAVTKGCVDNNSECRLSKKCNVCTKEIKDLDAIDVVLPGAPKKRGRPKIIMNSDIKIIQGPITVRFD